MPYKKNQLLFPCGSRLHILTHITGWMLVTPARNLMVYVAKHLSDTNTAIRSSFLQILNLDTHTKNRKPEPVLINLYDQQHKSWKISIFRATSPKAMKTYCTQYVIMDTTRKLETRKANKWSGFSMKDSSPTIANGGEERAPCLRMAYHCSTSPDVPLQV